jgi:hypothetical protein
MKRSRLARMTSMVDWPIDPVAPRIVMRLASGAAGPRRVLRHSHALHHHASSPAPALCAPELAAPTSTASQACGHQPVDPVQHTPVSRDHGTGILHAMVPLEERFEQVAQLLDDADDRGNDYHRCQRRHLHQPSRDPAGKRRPGGGAAQPGPGLVGRDRRRELRPADAAAGRIRRRIGAPHHHEQPPDGDQPVARIGAQRHQRHQRQRHVGHPGKHPEAVPVPGQRA